MGACKHEGTEMPDNKLPIQNPLADDGLFMVCRECFWYRGSLLRGLCHGVPPAVVPVAVREGNIIRSAFWPEMPGDEFCGMFKADRDKEYDQIPGLGLLDSAPHPLAPQPPEPEPLPVIHETDLREKVDDAVRCGCAG